MRLEEGKPTVSPRPPLRLLLVEDELDIRSLLTLHLERAGYEVVGVSEAEEALARLGAEAFDVVVLDWMLPGMSGLDLCKKLVAGRAEGLRVPPIMMMTARTSPQDILTALDSGADDYVTKPFDLPVVLARLRAILRRVTKPAARPGELSWGPLTLVPEDFVATRRGAELSLTRSEFKLLFALVKSEGRVLTRERLIDEVQGENVTVTDRTIDTHVFGLRKKLGESAGLVETIRGVGYRLRPHDLVPA